MCLFFIYAENRFSHDGADDYVNKSILQTSIRKHLVRLEFRYLVHPILANTTRSDETANMCMLVRVLSGHLCGNYHTFMQRLNKDFIMIFLEIKDTRHTKIKSFKNVCRRGSL